jgi:hypothetical protein
VSGDGALREGSPTVGCASAADGALLEAGGLVSGRGLRMPARLAVCSERRDALRRVCVMPPAILSESCVRVDYGSLEG